jgi:WD40 repeat protein
VPGYELRRLIGVGELGEVHRAYQASVGREVALRIFGPGMVGEPRFVRRFETAAQRATRVEHPRIVPLLDYWREPTRAVMVSRLMTGGDLGRRIRSDGMNAADALAVFEPLASGVASAHRHGVVHGRIRPENVLFDNENNAYVADLGVDEICAGVVTFATNAYDAPERLGGLLATPVADVYSLGVLAHHLLSGAAPPADGPLSVAEGPAADVLRRATDPDPGRRQVSVDELAAELRDALVGHATPSAVFIPTRNPYRGLAAFERADAADFFGRDRAVAEMITVLDRERLLVVVGPSGIGKSSAVKAGLLPALARGAITGSDSWLITEMMPGREPFEQLAAALDRVANRSVPDLVGALSTGGGAIDDVIDQLVPDDTHVLVVVDQLEELFTQTVDDGQRRAFLQMIAELARRPRGPMRLVATLRADYFDRPLEYPGFGHALKDRTLALGAMSATELADAVRLPAAAVGVDVEPALVERITTEAEQPGALPLVQHTMAELFERRETNTVTLADFEVAGGLTGAIGRRAESIYESFDERTREGARRVFLRLVSVSEDHEDTRRRVRCTELEQAGVSADDLDTVLGEYGRHRLITFDRDPASRTPTVELAHEALLTEWARYRRWVEEDRDDLLTRRRVETATRDWVSSGAEASFLYRGGRLELAESWVSTSGFELTDDERRFLAASREQADRDRKTRTRRRRILAGVLVAAVVATTALALVALGQRRSADREAELTRARELAGLAELAIEEDPERAVLLALAAAERTGEPLPEVASALHEATQSVRVVATTDGVMNVSFDVSPDGSLVAVDRPDRTGYVLIDPTNGEIVEDVATELEVAEGAVSFGPSSATLAVAYGNRPDDTAPAVQGFEVPGGRMVDSLSGPAGSYNELEHDDSGRWLAAVRVDPDERREIVVWDLDDVGPPRSLGLGIDFAFVPRTGSLVILGSEASGLTVIDVATGDVIRELDTPVDIEYFAVDVDPTGRLVAVGAPVGRRVDVLDLNDGAVLGSLAMPTPTSVRFSPDGRWLAVAGNDNFVRLFDLERFTEVQRLAGSPNQPFGLGFSPDGSSLVSGTPGHVRSWDLSPEGPPALGNFHVSGGFPGRFVISTDGSEALANVYTGSRTALHRVDLSTGAEEEVLAGIRIITGVHPIVARDFNTVLALDEDFVTNMFDLAASSGTPLRSCETVGAIDGTGRLVSLDGQILCTEIDMPVALDDTPVRSRIAELSTGRTILDLGEVAIWGAAFSPPVGEARIVTVVDGDSGVVTAYDLTTGAELGSFLPEDGAFPLNLAMSPDGRRLALSMTNGQLTVLDVEQLAGGGDPADAVAWTVTAHAGSVQTVAISEGGWIATGSSAGNTRVWSADGELVADLTLRLDDPPTLNFAPGTDTLYYEDGGGVIRRFTVDTHETAELARSLVTRGFTDDECARYFPDEECPTFDE